MAKNQDHEKSVGTERENDFNQAKA